MAKINWHGNEFMHEAERRIDAIADEASEDTKEHIKNMFGLSSPSQPGEPPAVDTGELRSTIEAVRIRQGVYKVGAFDPDNQNKSIFLEFGTSMMRARPFLRPAAKWSKKHFAKLLKRNLNR